MSSKLRQPMAHHLVDTEKLQNEFDIIMQIFSSAVW